MAEQERYTFDKPPAMCRECGVKVQDFDIHDGFHNWLRSLVEKTRLALASAHRHGYGQDA